MNISFWPLISDGKLCHKYVTITLQYISTHLQFNYEWGWTSIVIASILDIIYILCIQNPSAHNKTWKRFSLYPPQVFCANNFWWINILLLLKFNTFLFEHFSNFNISLFCINISTSNSWNCLYTIDESAHLQKLSNNLKVVKIKPKAKKYFYLSSQKLWQSSVYW